MLTLREGTFRSERVPVGTAWLLADCMEYRGKQELWTRHKPQVLRTLREEAIIHSVESSNRIEGVTVPRERLRPLVAGKARPRTCPEGEIAGYRRALTWIFTRRRPPPIDPRTIRHLHALAQSDETADAGQWKRRDNEIIEITPGGRGGGRRVRFVPTPAKETPAAMAALCRAYEEQSGAGVPPLLVIATAVFDFLCIHPFRDGNGRVSRLLTTLLLERHGFAVARFVALERLVEESKEEYYAVLARCSRDWAAGKNEIVPWWNYFLGIVRRGYAELEHKVESSTNRASKTDLARTAALAQIGEFTLADLAAGAPGVSTDLLKKVLQDLRKEGKVELSGRGRSAVWRVSDKS